MIRSNTYAQNNVLLFLLLIAQSIFAILPFDNISIVIISGIILFYIISGKTLLPQRVLPIILVVLLLFLFSFGFNGVNFYSIKYFTNFLAFGIISLYISQLDFDPTDVLYKISIFSLFMIPVYLSMDLHTDTGDWMGVSYDVLKFFAADFYVLFFTKYKFWVKLFSFVSICVYLWLYAQMASRGAILAIGVLVVIFFFIKKNYSVLKSITLLALFGTILYFTFFHLLAFISSILTNLNIDIYAINKILLFIDSGESLSNGRDSIFQLGFDYFMSSPIWGHGIGEFENEYNIVYVHNLFLQILDEGGIIWGIPIIYLVFKSILFMFNPKISMDIRCFIAFLFCTGIIRLIFSWNFWESQTFWLFFGFIIKLCSKKSIQVR